jgi:hypothetical protein
MKDERCEIRGRRAACATPTTFEGANEMLGTYVANPLSLRSYGDRLTAQRRKENAGALRVAQGFAHSPCWIDARSFVQFVLFVVSLPPPKPAPKFNADPYPISIYFLSHFYPLSILFLSDFYIGFRKLMLKHMPFFREFAIITRLRNFLSKE